MKILCICGDFYHPAAVVKKGLDFLSELNLDIRFLDDTTLGSPHWLKDYDVLILSKANMTVENKSRTWLNDQWEQEIDRFVRSGHKLLVIHSGTAGYDNNRKIRELIGGVFSHHPEQEAISYSASGNKAFMNEVQTFTEKDEQYFMTMDREDIDLILVSTSQQGTQPAGWFLKHDAGEVAVLTPGHNIEVWLNRQFQKILEEILKGWMKG
ncbi:ThuA domain-containing protein [Spirochaeta isovalerica]|uniref:Type 1 glutamine amidotransferase n=1 Tax=Spirochaeta isovalerica TaxID=150 RepID=A0A841RC02_9SPIO|nr:ThuA domain-containing protein [Spirochaeta isovalerica]MBB6479932.1 type 1 glutamine amidotransferase [Spirochaeta isovalerica]